MIKFSVLCWHFSAPGKNSTTGLVPGMAEPGRKFQPCTGIKNKTAHWEWGLKTAGRGMRFVCVRTASKCCEKPWGSRSGAAHAGTARAQNPPGCGDCKGTVTAPSTARDCSTSSNTSSWLWLKSEIQHLLLTEHLPGEHKYIEPKLSPE